MAKTSYIHPNVIKAWLVKLNADDIEKSMHGGIAYTLDYIKANFVYPTIKTDVDDEEEEVDEYLHPFWWDYGGLKDERFQFYKLKNYGKKRNEMPQVDTDSIADFVAKLDENGVKSSRIMMSIKKIKPTQNEINEEKVSKMIQENYDWAGRVYLVSNDNYLLDGHHALAVGLEQDPDKEVVVVKFDVKIGELLKRANLMKMTGKADLGGRIVKGLQIIEMAKQPHIPDYIRAAAIEAHPTYKDNLVPVWVEKGLDVKKVWMKQEFYDLTQNKPFSATIEKSDAGIYSTPMFKQEVTQILGKFRKKYGLDNTAELDVYKAASFAEHGTIGIKHDGKIYERRTKTFQAELDREDIIKAKAVSDKARIEEAFNKI